MTSYIVIYDLNKEETSADYKPLIDEIKKYRGHRFQKSAWLVAVNATAEVVHNHFKKFMDDNDSLWVSELVANTHYSGANGGTNQWLKDNPPAR